MHKKMIIFGIILAVLFVILVLHRDNRIKEQRKYIGMTAVIGKDTVIVMDYNSLFDTYTLSNGQKCDVELLVKLLEK